MPYPNWIVQMVLADSRVPEWQNNIPGLNLFSYYETVVAIARYRLKLASITSLIYSSHQPLVPWTSHLLWNFVCHISRRVKCLWRLRKEYRKGLLKLKLYSLLPWTSSSCHKQWMCHVPYVFILMGLLSLPIVRFSNKSCHRTPSSISFSFDECLLSWGFISAWCLPSCIEVCITCKSAQHNYWEDR